MRKIRYAVIGAGRISREAFLPALARTGDSEAAARGLHILVDKPIATSPAEAIIAAAQRAGRVASQLQRSPLGRAQQPFQA